MGRMIAQKVKGMNWRAKLSLILIFTLVFSTFMYQGLWKPKQTEAAVAAGTAWTNINATAPNNQNATVTSTGSFTAAAGTNRILLVSISCEINAGNQAMTVLSATYGGVTVNQIATTRASANRQHQWLGYILDVNIPAGLQTVAVTYNTGSATNTLAALNVDVATYTGVLQSAPAAGTFNANFAAGTTVATNAAVSYVIDGMTVFVTSNGGATATETITATPTLTQALVRQATQTSFAGASAVHTGVGNYASGGISIAFAGGTSTRSALAVVSLRPAAIVNPTVTSASPNNQTQGTGPTTVTINGTGFQSGAVVTFSGTGVTAGASTFVNATQITVPVTVTAGAATGLRNITVTNTDTGTGTGNNLFTVNAAVSCTRSAPTVSMGANGTVSAGLNKVYTVTVTNNDTAGCSNSTFTLSIASETGNTTSFTLPSALAPTTTGVLAPGAVYTGTTLTVVAQAGATNGHALTTTINASDATNHPAQTGSGAVLTTVAVAGASMMHNSTNMTANQSPKNYWAGQGGWGISGGKYGEFTCATCHAKTTTNIKRVKTSITSPNAPTDTFPGSTVNFQSVTGTANGFGDDQSTHATSSRICEVCHTQPAVHKYNQSGSTLHENTATTPANYQDCIECHEHKKGFALPGCIDCHAKQQGNRVAVVGQFSGNSHHIQGVDLSNTHCYQCHWEANANGSINYTYHLGWRNGLVATSNAAVDLVVWNATSRPAAYADGTTAVQYNIVAGAAWRTTELPKINSHCLGCHNTPNDAITPFGDGKTPKQYAWDGTSVGARYSQAGTTTWGKYTNTVTYPNAATKNVTKAYSAHGNAAANQRGWNTTTGYDSTPPNTSGGINVLCFDCHNSHGSSVAGTTTSYAAGSGVTNGGILKDTVAGQGGYSVTYRPATNAATTATRVKHNAGAGLCFDCHLTSNAMGGKPWSYDVTFGSSQILEGYVGKPGWAGAAGVNPSGAQQRYAYKNLIPSRGSHFEPSSSLTHGSAPAAGTINGLCTPCHDPHGVTTNTAVISAANKPYALPLLKGTWMTSPYKEDTAPLAMNLITGQSSQNRTGCPDCTFNSPYNQRSEPGYHIDQNTFSTTNLTANPPNWDWNITTTHPQPAEAVSQFGGLCLNCHAQDNINPNSSTTWKSFDRIHNTVKGWGGVGANANNAVHAFTCSKCHTPHHSSLPRLMISNCVDYKHRGRVASGGTAGNFEAPTPNPGRDGAGRGSYPSGGGGHGNTPRDNGPYYFGETGTGSNNTRPTLINCHNAAGAGGTGYPDSQLWNQKTPW